MKKKKEHSTLVSIFIGVLTIWIMIGFLTLIVIWGKEYPTATAVVVISLVGGFFGLIWGGN